MPTLSPAQVEAIRADFPILHRTVGQGSEQHPLVYLDSGATSQRPRQVLDAERTLAEHSYAAVHRGAHALAEESTDAFEGARAALAAFAGVPEDGLIWTRNATEGLNVIAMALSDAGAGEYALQPGDEIVVTEMEHHANLVPWQQAAARTGATLRWLPLTEEGRLDLSVLGDVVTERTKVLAFTQASNVLGTVNPVAELVAAARAVGALTVMDACQGVPHLPVNFTAMGVDLAVFSGHKMLGPTGIGVLAGNPDILNQLPPVLTGGSMVEQVTMSEATFRASPARFEAGTPPTAQAVGLHAAADYLSGVGMDAIAGYEHELAERMLKGIGAVPGVRILGPQDAQDRLATVAFVVDGVHPHDVGQFLDASGVAVRVGHHCAQPVHRRFGARSSTRASAYLYNTPAEIDTLCEALAGVRSYFSVAG